jgi:hypothetical protein
MIAPIISVKVISATELELGYEDGQRRVFDIAPFLEFEHFKALSSDALFKSARVRGGSIEWDNGIDIDPTELYEATRPAED